MKKETKLSIQWFYDLLEIGECNFVDFKEQLEDKIIFGKSLRNFAPNYEEMARDVVAFANLKGGFIFVGIVDANKSLNVNFQIEDNKIFDLIRNIQSRTTPSITVKTHKLSVDKTTLLVIEIPFSNQLHQTTRGEYLIRCNDGNRAIQPHEMSTILSEKNLIVFDQQIWKLNFTSHEIDKNGNSLPGWQDLEHTRILFARIHKQKPQSPYLKNSASEFTETLGLVKEDSGQYFPTTAGILLIGNQKALKELPYNQIKYVRYYEDGSHTSFEYSGNIIDMADACFNQLKAEIKTKEFTFGLFREYIEDYPEIVIRELLINALVHRDYSRQQIIEIRKYPDYLEIESPGLFPQGIDTTNFLRKTNPRNPNIMDVFREINYAEKAGSGFDKIFTALLSKGKNLPEPIQTDHSLIFRVNADIQAEKIAELSILYKQITSVDIGLEYLLVLNSIYTGSKVTVQQLLAEPFINSFQLRKILKDLEDLEFIESTGKTSGLKYIIHKSKLDSSEDKINYSKLKKQEKARQIESILRYLDGIDEIDNALARKLLVLPLNSASYISRLFAEMLKHDLIEIARESKHNQRTYKRKR